MQDPQPPTSWKPTRSVIGGSVLGTAVAQLVIAGVQYFLKVQIDPVVGGAITTICTFAATYFIPD